MRPRGLLRGSRADARWSPVVLALSRPTHRPSRASGGPGGACARLPVFTNDRTLTLSTVFLDCERTEFRISTVFRRTSDLHGLLNHPGLYLQKSKKSKSEPEAGCRPAPAPGRRPRPRESTPCHPVGPSDAARAFGAGRSVVCGARGPRLGGFSGFYLQN